jgi:hypothetical protein
MSRGSSLHGQKPIWEYLNGKYCQDSIKDYFMNLLELTEVFRGISMDLRGIKITKMEHKSYYEAQEQIIQVYKRVCFGKFLYS